jgi:hypothetical protein
MPCLLAVDDRPGLSGELNSAVQRPLADSREVDKHEACSAHGIVVQEVDIHSSVNIVVVVAYTDLERRIQHLVSMHSH